MTRNDVYLLKTPHHPRLRRDWRVPMWEVARSTAAAPTYLPAHVLSEDRTVLVDGGVWANNPSLVGTVEAVSLLRGQGPADLSAGIVPLGDCDPADAEFGLRHRPGPQSVRHEGADHAGGPQGIRRAATPSGSRPGSTTRCVTSSFADALCSARCRCPAPQLLWTGLRCVGGSRWPSKHSAYAAASVTPMSNSARPALSASLTSSPHH